MQLATISAKEARERFAEIVNRVVYGGEEIVITRYDRPEVVLVPFEERQRQKTKKDKEKERRKKIVGRFIKLSKEFGKWKASETIIRERDRERLKWQKLS